MTEIIDLTDANKQELAEDFRESNQPLSVWARGGCNSRKRRLRTGRSFTGKRRCNPVVCRLKRLIINEAYHTINVLMRLYFL